jgi:hypothetical protein
LARIERDDRLRERIEALEALPEPQRNHLVEFLDALISAHAALGRGAVRRGGGAVDGPAPAAGRL